MKKILFLLLVGFHFTSFAQLNKPKLDSLCTILNDSNKWMGSIGLYKNGEVLYENAWGLQDDLRGRPIDEKNRSSLATRYRIGSITKMFTACMIFQLIDEKKLTLSTTLATFYPEIKNANKITMEDLLTHHSGIFNFTNDSIFQSYIYTTKTHQEIIDILKTYTPVFEPGSKGEYSNSNYVLLGYIIEKITSRAYAYELQHRIVKKINVRNTYYGLPSRIEQHEASSFELDDNNTWQGVPQSDMSIPHGAGAIVSTPHDLAMFITALFQGKIISETSFKKMITLRDNFGYGIFQYPLFDKKVWGHNGRIEAFTSMLTYNPADSTCMAICSNGANGFTTNDMGIALASIYYEKKYSIPTFKAAPIDEVLLMALVGKYTSKEIPLAIALTKNGNALMAQATGQSAFPLTYVGNGLFEFTPAGIKIQVDVKTKKSFVLQQGGGHYTFDKK